MLHIVIVEEDGQAGEALSERILGNGMSVRLYQSGAAIIMDLPKNEPPDVILLNIHIPDIVCMSLIGILMNYHSDLRILAYGRATSNTTIRDIAHAGAVGYLHEEVLPEEVFGAIKIVHEGGVFFTAAIARELPQPSANKLIANNFNNALRFETNLTPRENEMLQELARGSSNKDIASKYGISRYTVNNHLCKIYDKLQVKSRTEAVAMVTGVFNKSEDIENIKKKECTKGICNSCKEPVTLGNILCIFTQKETSQTVPPLSLPNSHKVKKSIPIKIPANPRRKLSPV